MDLATQLLPLIVEQKWLPVAALSIGLAVRLLKDDTILPTVPARYRAALALGLGMALGVVQAIIGGKPWRAALGEGLLAASIAIIGHTLGIEGLRGGREIGGSK